jgi:hypothetical protein
MKLEEQSSSGTQSSALEIIRPQIERALELVEHTPDEQVWPSLLAPIWVEAVCALIRHALHQAGRHDAAEIRARRFKRMDAADQRAVAARHGVGMDQFMRIIRTARGFRRSSCRPPPRSMTPPRFRRQSGVERVGVVLDPRLRKINPR